MSDGGYEGQTYWQDKCAYLEAENARLRAELTSKTLRWQTEKPSQEDDDKSFWITADGFDRPVIAQYRWPMDCFYTQCNRHYRDEFNFKWAGPIEMPEE